MVGKKNAAPALETRERRIERISYDSYVRRIAELLLLELLRKPIVVSPQDFLEEN